VWYNVYLAIDRIDPADQMMSQLLLTCFGDFRVTLAGEPLTAFQTEKVRALLVYLAVEGQPHPRTELAQLLWPGYSGESANNSLRQTLHRLRHLLYEATSAPGGGGPSGAPWLLITRQTVQFNPTASMQVDATSFTRLIAECTAHAHAQLVTCQPCCLRLRQAVELYCGDFLAGFTVADSDSFEEWRRITQEQLHLQVLDALTQLANTAEAAGDDEQALHDSRRQLILEPWLEDAHRRVMRILAKRGQRAAAIAQYQRCRQVLAEEIGTAPDQETTALYEAIRRRAFDRMTSWQDDAMNESLHPVILSSPHPVTPAHNLPPSSTPLVGRTQALAEIVNQLHLPGVRLLTLVGPGGMGKTRLALEVGRDLLTTFADGVFFVPLAAISSPAALAPAIATAIGLPLQGSEPRTALLHILRQKQILLILDNFEHLLLDEADGVELVVELLGTAGVQIIVTSRERLMLRAEHLYPVQALAFSPNATLAEASAASAVRLFVQCVQRRQADFQLTAANLSTVLRICDLVQGMPLGLELAAAWCDALALDEIADEIERSIDFLAADYHDLPERQRSMRAIFAWSWRLLREDEARVLRQLAVFRGGFTRQAAETICGASLRVLNGLVNKSLLRHVSTTSEHSGTGIGRYELHELLRQFAQEQLLARTDEWTKTVTRHSEFYLAFVAERERRLLRNEPRQATAEIQTELDNVRQAWSNGAHNRAGATLDLGAYGLWQFYLLAGLSAEGVQAFLLAATALQDSPADKLAESSAEPQAFILSKLWALSAYLLGTHGNYDEAVEAAQRAIGLANAGQPNVASQMAAALGHLAWGRALYHQSQFSESQTHNEQVLRAARAAQHDRPSDEIWPEIEVQARLNLSVIARTQGEYLLAKSQLADCLRLCQQLGKVRGEVHAQLNLGFTARLLHEERTARQAYEQVLPLTIDLHYRWGEGVAYHELALVVRDLGEYSLSLTLCQQALPIFVEINERLKQMYVLTNLIELYSLLGQFENATGYQTQLLTLLQHFKAPDAERATLVANAMRAHYQGDHEQAFACAHQLWQLVQPTSSRFDQAEALTLLGQAQVALHRQTDATDSYTQALTLYQSLGAPAQAAEAQAGLAGIALAQGDLARAQQLVEAVLTTLEQHPNAGIYEPFPIFLTCYRVLATTHDPRARTVLQTAYDLLQSYAAHIDDEDLHHSFLQNVSVHRQLQQIHAEINRPQETMPTLRTAPSLPTGPSSP
jgi:predicted ATPase/DNA-binding SARP family transcriptional activator